MCACITVIKIKLKKNQLKLDYEVLSLVKAMHGDLEPNRFYNFEQGPQPLRLTFFIYKIMKNNSCLRELL